MGSEQHGLLYTEALTTNELPSQITSSLTHISVGRMIFVCVVSCSIIKTIVFGWCFTFGNWRNAFLHVFIHICVNSFEIIFIEHLHCSESWFLSENSLFGDSRGHLASTCPGSFPESPNVLNVLSSTPLLGLSSEALMHSSLERLPGPSHLSHTPWRELWPWLHMFWSKLRAALLGKILALSRLPHPQAGDSVLRILYHLLIFIKDVCKPSSGFIYLFTLLYIHSFILSMLLV